MYSLKSIFFALFLFAFQTLSGEPVNQAAIPINYQLMDEAAFQKIVVGNTVAGVSGNSKSLYLLHFGKDGSCDMWKQNKVYPGSWWIEKDELGRDFMRAYWPAYSSKTDATSYWYYVDPKQSDTLIAATKTSRCPVLVIPGRAFPN